MIDLFFELFFDFIFVVFELFFVYFWFVLIELLWNFIEFLLCFSWVGMLCFMVVCEGGLESYEFWYGCWGIDVSPYWIWAAKNEKNYVNHPGPFRVSYSLKTRHSISDTHFQYIFIDKILPSNPGIFFDMFLSIYFYRCFSHLTIWLNVVGTIKGKSYLPDIAMISF